MTKQDALNEIQELLISRRKYAFGQHTYCSKCRNRDAMYVITSIMDGTSECEECFINRKYKEIAPQICEEDSSEVKAQRAQTVRDYFKARKCSETFTEKSHQL